MLTDFPYNAISEPFIKGGFRIAERASFEGRMGLEKTEGDEGCCAEGVFLTGPG
jgi:hypothetical protein